VPIEILSYNTSFLNPLMKLFIIGLFGLGTWYFYQASKKYGGNLGHIATILMWGGIAGCIAAIFRFLGDFFTQYKWMESTVSLLFGLICVLVAYLVYTKFAEIADAFGLSGDK
jgi:hypothetical protein